MNPVSVQKKLKKIIGNGLPVECVTPWGTLTGSFSAVKNEVLLLTYGSIEDYTLSILFAEGDFPPGILPRKGDSFTVKDRKLYVMGIRQEPGISVTVDLRG